MDKLDQFEGERQDEGSEEGTRIPPRMVIMVSGYEAVSEKRECGSSEAYGSNIN